MLVCRKALSMQLYSIKRRSYTFYIKLFVVLLGKHYLRGKRIGSIRNPNRVVSLARGEVSGFVPKVKPMPM